MTNDILRSHLSLLAASTGLAVVLHHLEQRYPIKPAKVWMEVAAGVTLTMLWSRWYSQQQEKSGQAVTWRDYDSIVWTSFLVSGVPQVLWQEWLHMEKS